MEILLEKEQQMLPETETSEGELTTADVFAYGAGGVPATVPTTLKSTFLQAFMTDIAGLPSATAGIILSVMVVWDGINDPIIAMMADRTNTKRFGKYRPWMLASAIPLLFLIMMMFRVPSSLGTTGVTVYYAVVLFLYSWIYTMFLVPYQTLNNVLTTNVEKRNKLLSNRQMFCVISSLLISVVAMSVVNAFEKEADGWFAIAVGVAVSTFVCILIVDRGVRKYDYHNALPTPDHFSIKDQVRIVIKNPPMLIVIGIFATLNLALYIYTSSQFYFLRSVLGSTAPIAISSVVSLAGSFIIVPLIPKLLQKLGKVKLMAICMVAGTAFPIGLLVARSAFLAEDYQFNNTFLMLYLVLVCFSYLGWIVGNVVSYTFIMDVSDYTEYKFGETQSGFVTSSITLMRKLSTSLGPLLVGFALQSVGYAAGMDQHPAVRQAIYDVTAWPIIIVSVLCLVLLKIYPITPEISAKIRAANRANHGANQNL